MAECALALGFERMKSGSLGTYFPDRPPPMTPFHVTMETIETEVLGGSNFGPAAPRMFADSAQEYFDKYGANIGHLAQIGLALPFSFLANDGIDD